MKPFPTLETSRLLLRQLAEKDAHDVLALYGDDAVTRFSELVTLADVAQARLIIRQFNDMFADDGGIRWAIVQRTDSRVIGTCGLGWHRPNRSALISYDIARGHWNNGFATEAMRAVIHHCFSATDTNRISSTTIVDNAASMRVLDKVGFREEGVLRQWGYWKGKFVDLRCFSLLREDYFQSGTGK